MHLRLFGSWNRDMAQYRRFLHTTEHDRVYAIRINETDCEILQAYLSESLLRVEELLSYAPG
jgi:hypothetical protein